MLVLRRKVGEEVVIADNVYVKVLAINGGRVQLGIVAPRSVAVDRGEVRARHAVGVPDGAAPAVRELAAF